MPMPGLIDVDVTKAVVAVGPKSVEATFQTWDPPKQGKPFWPADKNAPQVTVHAPKFLIRNLANKPIWHIQYVLYGYDSTGKLYAGPLGPQGMDLALKVGEAKEVALGAMAVIDPPLSPEIEIASVAFADFSAEVYPPPLRAAPASWWKVDVPRPSGGFPPYKP
jgi:hypothetical protein